MPESSLYWDKTGGQGPRFECIGATYVKRINKRAPILPAWKSTYETVFNFEVWRYRSYGKLFDGETTNTCRST